MDNLCIDEKELLRLYGMKKGVELVNYIKAELQKMSINQFNYYVNVAFSSLDPCGAKPLIQTKINIFKRHIKPLPLPLLTAIQSADLIYNVDTDIEIKLYFFVKELENYYNGYVSYAESVAASINNNIHRLN